MTAPKSMDSVLDDIRGILQQKDTGEQVVTTIVKSLFYGLWNFDKMINQHHLSTQIANLLHQVPSDKM